MTTPGDPKRKPLDEYVEVQPLLRQVRVMQRFVDEVVDEPPYRQHLPELHGGFMDILKEELAPHALTLALAITELEDVYPEIVLRPDEERPARQSAARLTFVEKVTRTQGEAFADWWSNESNNEGILTQALWKARLMTWPEGDHMTQNRYCATHNRIARRVLEELRETIIRRFVKVANEELAEERRKIR